MLVQAEGRRSAVILFFRFLETFYYGFRINHAHAEGQSLFHVRMLASSRAFLQRLFLFSASFPLRLRRLSGGLSFSPTMVGALIMAQHLSCADVRLYPGIREVRHGRAQHGESAGQPVHNASVASCPF